MKANRAVVGQKARLECVEVGCESEVARNKDGTFEGNWRCPRHTYHYYAPVILRRLQSDDFGSPDIIALDRIEQDQADMREAA